MPPPAGYERLPLPGPRPLWWALAVAATLLPFATSLSIDTGSAPAAELAALRFEIRVRNLMTIMAASAGMGPLAPQEDDETAPLPAAASPSAAATATADPPGAVTALAVAPDDPPAAMPVAATLAAGAADDATPALSGAALDQPTPATPAEALGPAWRRPRGGGQGEATSAEAHQDATARRAARAAATKELGDQLRELHDRALSIERGQPSLGRRARAEVIAAAVALDLPRVAVELAAEGGAGPLAADARAALATLGPMAPPQALPIDEALARGRRERYGHDFSPWVRDRVRARIGARAGDRDLARGAHVRLAALEDDVVPAIGAAAQLLGLFAVVGVGLWLWWILSALGARRRGASAFAALRALLPGVTAPAPWPTDPLLPWLGLGTWLAGTMVAGLVMAMLPSARDGSGLAVLFQGLAGVLVAWALVSAFGRGGTPLETAALADGEGSRGALGGSVVALLAYCALLPAMLSAAALSAALDAWLAPGSGGALHPVAALLLDDAGPVQIFALALAVAVAAPVGEELVFRGFLYRALRDRLGPGRAVAITAIAFAAIHMTLPMLLPYVLLGVAFAVLYELVGSLWPSIILHALWNGAVLGGIVLVAQV